MRKSLAFTRIVGQYLRRVDSLGALGLLFLCIVVGTIWKFRISMNADQYDLWVEFVGLIFDVVVVLVLFSFFQFLRNQGSHKETQRDIIEDYKAWDNEEANFRLAGAIRRLNRLGETEIDLTGARISDFSFPKNGVESLRGSTIYDGKWGETVGDSSVTLSSVEFNHVDCRSVTFSAGDPFSGMHIGIRRHANFEDCTFVDTDLRGAVFNGASLKWTDPPPESRHELVEDPKTGQVSQVPESYGPFYEADLSGASFSKCIFVNADFREAKNILEAKFSGAVGLEEAAFDSSEVRQAVLEKVKVIS